jgi:hypothetical protein
MIAQLRGGSTDRKAAWLAALVVGRTAADALLPLSIMARR